MRVSVMQRSVISLVLALALGVGVVSTTVSAAAGAAGAPKKAKPTTSTAVATTLPVVTVPSTIGSVPEGAAAPTGKILMVKLYVDDLEAGERFYGAVFGAKLALKVGENAHIVTFPDGGPGLVLLKKTANDKKKVGAFIIQVPDLSAAQALAIANGAKEQGKFAGNPGSQAAKSQDFLDPWGNQVEILQLG
jgi:predicted enzyme related to lactoylglutathione lyase